MIGKLVGGTFKVLMRIISVIPFIGDPLVRFICFFVENLFQAIRKLPYVIGGLFVVWFALSLLGII
jgi:hypothetical protein